MPQARILQDETDRVLNDTKLRKGVLKQFGARKKT